MIENYKYDYYRMTGETYRVGLKVLCIGFSVTIFGLHFGIGNTKKHRV